MTRSISAGACEVTLGSTPLMLLPEKAVWMPETRRLLLSDLHLGKAETFQRAGIPVANQLNASNLERLQRLCDRHDPAQIFILGDLFHAASGLVEEVIDAWVQTLGSLAGQVWVIVGNHDRALVKQVNSAAFHWVDQAITVDTAHGAMVLSHEPIATAAQWNICGHVHPCVVLRSRLDTLRLPCFYVDYREHRLILPSFGEFTGGYELPLTRQTAAYAIADAQVIPLGDR